MSRDEIMAAVKRKAAAIIRGLQPDSIDSSKSLKHYGATSLDLVEIVSGLMRELRARVPRSELAKIDTIDGLVDLLHRTLAEQGAK
jgi:acyl carrier protein